VHASCFGIPEAVYPTGNEPVNSKNSAINYVLSLISFIDLQ